MSAEFDTKLNEVVTYYNYHQGTQEDLMKMVEFQGDIIRNMLRMLVMVAEDLKVAEGRKSKFLYVPSSLNVEGDVKRFG